MKYELQKVNKVTYVIVLRVLFELKIINEGNFCKLLRFENCFKRN
jgi:hypothetical protein